MSNKDKAYYVPSNWNVISNDGTILVAKNIVTGDTYNGSTVNFNAIIKNSYVEDEPVMARRTLTGGIKKLVASGKDVFSFSAGANAVIKSYGSRAFDTCANGITIGTTTLTHALSNERPRFQTYTRKCQITSDAGAEIRFASISFTADQSKKALSIDVYLEFPPSEFLGGSNPYIDFSISNTTSLGSNYSRWSFNSSYLRQGWNTLKMFQSDTVSATSGAGNLATGKNHSADVGTGFDWALPCQFFKLVFWNMNGKTVHVDELRNAAKAQPVLTIGFDASGYSNTDEVYPLKVAPLFASAGIKSYCTLTAIYELIYAGNQAWVRLANLANSYQWDIINHTWSHGGTQVGASKVINSLVRATNVVTGTVSGGHGLPVNKVIKASIQGATGTPGLDMNTSAAAAMPDVTVINTTQFTYASVGTDGAATGSPKIYTYLSEVFSANNAENLRLLSHELLDMARVQKGSGFSKSVPWAAFPNNSVPELYLLESVAASAGIKYCRGYRGGFCFVNEFGVDNPLNMGAFSLGSSATDLKVSELTVKIQAAIDRGEHIHIYGHFIVDDEDPANAAYKPVDIDYPPGQGGNPAPPAAGDISASGWWYLSALRRLITQIVYPSVLSGDLLVLSPSEYSVFMGEN